MVGPDTQFHAEHLGGGAQQGGTNHHCGISPLPPEPEFHANSHEKAVPDFLGRVGNLFLG
jgi:hypothetical protein